MTARSSTQQHYLLGAGAVLCALFIACWAWYYYDVVWIPRHLDGAKIGQNGLTIVRTIFRFKQERGLWPQGIEDILSFKPEGVTPWIIFLRVGRPFAGNYEDRVQWSYKTRIDCGSYWGWSLSSDTGRWGPWVHVQVWGGFGQLGAYPMHWALYGVPAELSAPSDQVWRNMMAEYERRIQGDPTNILHYQGKLSALAYAGKWEEIRKLCAEYGARFPDSRWFERAVLETKALEEGKSTLPPMGTEPKDDMVFWFHQ